METKTGVVMVMTGDSLDKILADAGVFVPRVNTEKLLATCKYIVCCQNNPDNSEDESFFAHKEAFLIGTVNGVSNVNANGEKLISFDTYAEIQKRNAWANGPTRIGISYYDSPTSAKLRIGSYDFKSVKKPTTENVTIRTPAFAMNEAKELFSESIDFENKSSAVTQSKSVKNTGFDLTEAKALIAKALGVTTDQVEIIVKA